MAITHDAYLPLITGEGLSAHIGEASLPLLTGLGLFASSGDSSLPLLTAEGAMIGGDVAAGDASLFLVVGEGTVLQQATGDASLAVLRGAGVVASGDVGSGDADIPLLLGSGASYQGSVHIGLAALPMLLGAGALDVVSSSDGTTLLVNLDSLGHSVYTGDLYSSVTGYAKLGSSYLVCTPTGIYEMYGDTDSGTAITAEALSGLTDMGNPERPGANDSLKKRINSMFVRCRLYGDLATVAVSGEESKRIINIIQSKDEKNQQGMHNRRTKLGRGLTSREWQFGVQNVAGSDIEVEYLEIDPVLLKRRT